MVGAHTVSAVYAGSVNYRPSTSADVNQAVHKAASRTVVVSSAPTSIRQATVVFTATVTARAPGAGTPTGAVQFQLDGVNTGLAMSLNPSGQAAYATNLLADGRHTIKVVYLGDGSFTTSTSGAITQRVR